MLTDAAGRPVPTGRVHKTFAADFGVDAALPSWLQAGAGTASIIGVGSGQGAARVTSGAVSGNVASLQTAALFDPSQFTELAVTVEGLSFNTDALMAPSLRMDIGGAGVALVQNEVEATSSFRIVGGTNTFIPVAYPFRGGGLATQRRNLTLRWRIRTQELFVEEDGEVYGYAQSSALLTTATVRPLVNVTTKQAVAAWVQCERFIVETWSN